ncbi:MAG: hypothetical protein JWM16_4419 [Verrucomicrobiales bacterium]|nr:hypothetical protein [Verrucomicrobiales bacterium]
MRAALRGLHSLARERVATPGEGLWDESDPGGEGGFEPLGFRARGKGEKDLRLAKAARPTEWARGSQPAQGFAPAKAR